MTKPVDPKEVVSSVYGVKSKAIIEDPDSVCPFID